MHFILQVLLGRGKPFQNHWGNLQMVKLLEEREEEYKQADRFQKTCLSWEMVKKIQREYDGRFLEKDDALDQWYVCVCVCMHIVSLLFQLQYLRCSN